MSTGPWRRLKTPPPAGGYVPPDGWVQVSSCLWIPPNYAPDEWELPYPTCDTRQQQREEFLRCEASVAYFSFRFCWTVHVDDPSGEPQYRKIPAYPYLRDLYAVANPPRNTHCEKSRQMLTSWGWMSVFLHDLTFRDRWPSLVVSRRAKEVDDGGENSTIDSLLGKLRFMHEHLPPFLRFQFAYKLFLVSNPSRKSYVKGETGKAGGVARGPAYPRALKDEAAYVPHSQSVHKGLKQACKNGYIMNSTPDGKGNAFAFIRFNPGSTFTKITLHWTAHPEKARGLYCTCGWRADERKPGAPVDQFKAHRCANAKKDPARPPEPRSPWYDAQRADLTEEQVASELDISYSKSRRGRVYSSFDAISHVFDHTAIVDRRTGKPVGDPRPGEEAQDYRIRYLAAAIDLRKPIGVAWDFGVNDPTAVLLGQPDDDGKGVRWLDVMSGSDGSYVHWHKQIVRIWYVAYLLAHGWTRATIEEWAERRHLLDAWKAERRVVLVPDLWTEVPPRTMKAWHAGDPTGKNRDSSLKSWISNLRGSRPSMVVHYREHQDEETGSLLEWIDWTRTQVAERRVTVSSYAAELIDAYEQWHWPVNKDTGEPIEGAVLPVHDEFSHPMMAQLYFNRTRWHEHLHDRAGRRATADTVLAMNERRVRGADDDEAFSGGMPERF